MLLLDLSDKQPTKTEAKHCSFHEKTNKRHPPLALRIPAKVIHRSTQTKQNQKRPATPRRFPPSPGEGGTMENQNKSRVTRGGLTLRGQGREGRDPPGGHKYPRRWEIVWAAPASLTSGDAAERVRGLGHNDSAAATAVTAKRLTTHVAERARGRACSSDDGRVPATTGAARGTPFSRYEPEL